MRLDELIDTKIKNREVMDHDYKSLKDERDNNLSNVSSSGTFGKVTQHKSDPHLVKKSNYLPVVNLESNDGYFYYIKSIVDGNLADSNPYFPRVYDIKTFTDKFGDQRYRISLEKLISVYDVTDEELINLGKQIFPKFKEKLQKTGNLIASFMYFIYNNITTDENLKNALDFIKKLLEKNPNILDDLSEENIMFRRTKYGIQLVIVDPFSNK